MSDNGNTSSPACVFGLLLRLVARILCNRTTDDTTGDADRGRMTTRHWLVLGLMLALTGGCHASKTQQPQPPNILLIVVDTLRADKLGCYGSTLGATPNLDALSREGVLFKKAYSHAPWTLPSFASLLTSLTPPLHGAGGQMPNFKQPAAFARTVAECFRDAGYATREIVNVDFLTAPFGMTRGFNEVDFDVHDNNAEKRSAADTTDAAAAWIEKNGDKPFFLMAHYFDAHLIYSPPPEYRRRFAEPQDRENSTWVLGTRPQVAAYRRGLVQYGEATIRRAEKLYNGEVAYVDAEIGRLLAELTKLHLRGHTIVVVTADHGEEFCDHGGFDHGHSLYNELLHVPLIIDWPGRLSPAVATRTVGLIDVAPTLCALAGVAPASTFIGSTLFRDDMTPANQPHPVLLEGNFWGPALRGWQSGGYKLIVAPQDTMLFNLKDDPAEQHDLSKAEPDRVILMRAEMEQARTRPSLQPESIPHSRLRDKMPGM